MTCNAYVLILFLFVYIFRLLCHRPKLISKIVGCSKPRDSKSDPTHIYLARQGIRHLAQSAKDHFWAVEGDPTSREDNDRLRKEWIPMKMVYVSYGQNTLDLDHDLEGLLDIPPPPSDDVMDLWAQREQPVDSFTLTHHDLNICTNSLQYEMLLDVINNLLLHVEPHRKEASERLQRLRFQLQLSSTEDQRRPVQQIQNQLRSLISQLRRLEKDIFMFQRALSEDPSIAQLIAEIESQERKV